MWCSHVCDLLSRLLSAKTMDPQLAAREDDNLLILGHAGQRVKRHCGRHTCESGCADLHAHLSDIVEGDRARGGLGGVEQGEVDPFAH